MFYGCVENVLRSIDQCHLPEHHGCEVRNERGKKKPSAHRIISQETFFFFFFFLKTTPFIGCLFALLTTQFLLILMDYLSSSTALKNYATISP